jgi:hypothetical protein
LSSGRPELVVPSADWTIPWSSSSLDDGTCNNIRQARWSSLNLRGITIGRESSECGQWRLQWRIAILDGLPQFDLSSYSRLDQEIVGFFIVTTRDGGLIAPVDLSTEGTATG